MAFDLRRLVAEAERLSLPFMPVPIDLERCPEHPNKAYQLNFRGLLVCPHSSHQPARGNGEE